MTPFLDFRRMADADADAYLEAWLATSDERIAWLRERARAELPLRRDGFLDAWGAYLRWWDAGGADERGGPPPMWWRNPVATEPLAPPALWWVDAIAHYWGAVTRAEYPQLEWRRFDSGDRLVDIHNRPVLMLPGDETVAFEPLRTTYVLALGVRRRAPAPYGRTYAASEPEVVAEIHARKVAHIERALSELEQR